MLYRRTDVPLSFRGILHMVQNPDVVSQGICATSCCTIPHRASLRKSPHVLEVSGREALHFREGFLQICCQAVDDLSAPAFAFLTNQNVPSIRQYRSTSSRLTATDARSCDSRMAAASIPAARHDSCPAVILIWPSQSSRFLIVSFVLALQPTRRASGPPNTAAARFTSKLIPSLLIRAGHSGQKHANRVQPRVELLPKTVVAARTQSTRSDRLDRTPQRAECFPSPSPENSDRRAT